MKHNLKNLRKMIRRLIMESAVSSAKGIGHLIPGKHTIEVTGRSRGVSVKMNYEGEQIFRLNVVSATGNPDVYMVGAAYVEDDKADGFGPLMYDIAMEYTTKVLGKWLTADRGSCTEDAQKVWQFYLDNRVGNGITALQLDNTQNIMTSTSDDNVDTRQADDVLMGFGSGYWSSDDPDTYQRDFYAGNGMMHAFKKDADIIPQLLKMPEIFSINRW